MLVPGGLMPSPGLRRHQGSHGARHPGSQTTHTHKIKQQKKSFKNACDISRKWREEDRASSLRPGPHLYSQEASRPLLTYWKRTSDILIWWLHLEPCFQNQVLSIRLGVACGMTVPVGASSHQQSSGLEAGQ